MRRADPVPVVAASRLCLPAALLPLLPLLLLASLFPQHHVCDAALVTAVRRPRYAQALRLSEVATRTRRFDWPSSGGYTLDPCDTNADCQTGTHVCDYGFCLPLDDKFCTDPCTSCKAYPAEQCADDEHAGITCTSVTAAKHFDIPIVPCKRADALKREKASVVKSNKSEKSEKATKAEKSGKAAKKEKSTSKSAKSGKSAGGAKTEKKGKGSSKKDETKSAKSGAAEKGGQTRKANEAGPAPREKVDSVPLSPNVLTSQLLLPANTAFGPAAAPASAPAVETTTTPETTVDPAEDESTE